jgi:hypothetical protein
LQMQHLHLKCNICHNAKGTHKAKVKWKLRAIDIKRKWWTCAPVHSVLFLFQKLCLHTQLTAVPVSEALLAHSHGVATCKNLCHSH